MPNYQLGHEPANRTVEKTLMTSRLFEGFWDRWIAHGLTRKTAEDLRKMVRNPEDWVDALNLAAEDNQRKAAYFHEQFRCEDAERFYRLSGMHLNLMQWLFPAADEFKRNLYSSSKEWIHKADAVAKDDIRMPVVQMDGQPCYGRVRIPKDPQGCVILINPIDSSKEELFSYEMDFAAAGFVTFNFDGPGQGETYAFNGLLASRRNWSLYVNKVIEYAASQFPHLRLHLFGTSSGGAWAIEGSKHPKVSKAVSVSPALRSEVSMPDYFKERMGYILEDADEMMLPTLDELTLCHPILLFHGNQDVMVRDADIYTLYERLPGGKRMIEYENEGHCCNFKLDEIRRLSAEWFAEDKT